MKKLLVLLPFAAAALHSCTTFTPSFKSFLVPQEVTVNAVSLGRGHAILIANGTDQTLTSVAVRLEGISPDEVVGAWNCAASVSFPDSSICTVGTKLLPNDGLSLFTSRKITGGELGYNIGTVFTRTAIKVR